MGNYELPQCNNSEDYIKDLVYKIQNNRNIDALILAVRNNKISKVKQLLDGGADVNGKNEFFMSPLMVAAAHGYDEIAQFLIRKGAAVNSMDHCNRTTLLWAVSGNNVNMVKLLLANGADINTRDIWERTPLSYAKNMNYSKIVDLLILNQQ